MPYKKVSVDGRRNNGGHSPKGAGRPRGSYSAITTIARVQAMFTGIPPHVWLLSVMRGEPIEQRRIEDGKVIIDLVWLFSSVMRGERIEERRIENGNVIIDLVYPPFKTRLAAGKAAAPYYAPRLATQVITPNGKENSLESWTDEEVEAEIKKYEFYIPKA